MSWEIPINSKIETIKHSNVPMELINSTSRELHHYQVGILKITNDDAILVGSGTLVEIDGIFGILTAHHVMEVLPKPGEIGITLSSSKHRYTIKSDCLNKVKVARGSIESEGPDLGIIVFLSPADVSEIQARKSFYNLSLKRNKILNNPPENDLGTWFLCGIPDEMTIREESSKGFICLCGAGGLGKEYTTGEYDYLEINAHYNGINQLPQSFGGVSGGGLWQVILISREGKLEAGEKILSGVAFYQSSVSNNVRSIKCHGRRSVYKLAFEVVKNIYG